MPVDIQFDVPAENLAHQLVADVKELEKASIRALNKTVAWLRTYTVRGLSLSTDVQQKLLRKRIRVLRASQKMLTAWLKGRFYNVKAYKLGARQSKKGVRAGKEFFEGAFLARMPNGKIGVFQRKTDDRLPIEEKTVPIIDQAEEVIEELLERKAFRQFNKFFDHEIRFLTRNV